MKLEVAETLLQISGKYDLCFNPAKFKFLMHK